MGSIRPSPPTLTGGTYTLVTPELVDNDPCLDLFVLPPRLNRYRRRQRWIRKAERLRSLCDGARE
jgi:hypothetical protein